MPRGVLDALLLSPYDPLYSDDVRSLISTVVSTRLIPLSMTCAVIDAASA